jgi:RNA polymerase sigma-70 factor (ECF subfamily)
MHPQVEEACRRQEPPRTPGSSPDRVADAYANHGSNLRRFANARLRDPAAADDIVQESFARLAAEDRAGRYPREPRAWLFRVALNLIISGARTARSRSGQGIESRLATVDYRTPETEYLALEEGLDLEAALEAVGPMARAGLVMASEGYSGREIAAALGRSELATRALLWRSRTTVRRVLAPRTAV